TGPILLQEKTLIGEKETAPELMARLSETGAALLGRTLTELDTLTPRTQDHDAASFAPILKKEDGLIEWSTRAVEIERRIRGLQPWPNAHTTLHSRGLTIWSAEPIFVESAATPGEV